MNLKLNYSELIFFVVTRNIETEIGIYSAHRKDNIVQTITQVER